jgi:enterochelin esterase family protein
VRHGRIVSETFESEVLRGNPAGDPHVRELVLYLPPGYDEGDERYPVVFHLSGFLGKGRAYLGYEPFTEALPERMDRLISSGEVAPMIVAMPDCFTRYGGSQYRNSAATGRYADHVVDELVPHVDRAWRTRPDRRGVAGKSSGGYGALSLGLERPGAFHAVVSHSGDSYFEYCYLPDFPYTVNALNAAGGLDGFLEEHDRKAPLGRADVRALNVVAMAAAYSDDPTAPHGFELPFTLPDGELRREVWERWLEKDPVRLAEERADALRDLRLLFVDCGTRDEWNLHLGARILCRRLAERGVRFTHEEFDGGHRRIQYRYDSSLRALSEALAGE